MAQQLGFRETEPDVGIQFTSLFDIVSQEIENRDSATGTEHAKRLCEGDMWMQRMMKHLVHQNQIDFTRVDWKVLHISSAIL